MRGIAGATALALALVGCGTKLWLLIPLDASVGPLSDEGAFDAGAEAAGSDGPPPFILYCDTESDCLQLGWHCDLNGHECVQCRGDPDCSKLPRATHCNFSSTCVECVSDPVDTCADAGKRCDVSNCFYPCFPDGGGCPAVAPLCNTNSGRFVCASCLTNDDCADAAVPGCCNHGMGTCGECDQLRPPGPDASSVLDASDVAAEAPSIVDAADSGG